jgi:hypothetical protein
MLKKITISLMLFLFLFLTNVYADIIVDAEGKIQQYPDGITLNIADVKNLSFEYYGIKMFVPKGEKISIRFSDEDTNYMIFCTGDSFKNIKIGNVTVYSDKPISFSVSQDGKLKVGKGSLTVKDEKDKVVVLGQGNIYELLGGALSVEPIINKSKKSKKITRNSVMSPSAPRN